MTPRQHQHVKVLFLAARERPESQRRAFLRDACGDDAEILAEVEALLVEDAAPGSIEPPRLPELPFRETGDGMIGRRIGRYCILDVLGVGGMGVVYCAEQDAPQRRVALKVISPGIATRVTLRRFEHEAQVLARLQHPGIAPIYEAGSFDGGAGKQPYFAMELVQGLPLTEYAQCHALGLRDRLDLITKVCAAVQHAHQKGIVHRDLKPGNILVTETGEVKVLDFGVARAIDSDLQSATLRTSTGELIGTIPYMSPEQAAGDPHDIDTRSDIYSLGVVLYELLTGRLPHDVSGVMPLEAARVIREEPPARPALLDRALRGDVETITLKALEKDPHRRYRSAAALADDIARYLRSEPIQARRPSAAYQLSRLVRRHRVLSAVLATLLVMLLAGLTTTSLLLVRATHAESRVLRLADVKLVTDYETQADVLWPAHPERIDDLERWLVEARALCERLSGHEAELLALRECALPRSPEEVAADRASHPRLAELETALGRLSWLRRSLAARRGRAVEPAPTPDWETLPDDASKLWRFAARRIGPERELFGEEARALAIARRAVEMAPDNPAMHRTLAWALFANGFDAEAEVAAQRALDTPEEDDREASERTLERIRQEIAAVAGPEGLERQRQQIAEAETLVDELEDEVAVRCTWRFVEAAQDWQHQVLTELVERLETLGAPEAGTIAEVENRLEFARAIEERSVTGPAARAAWVAAIELIADREACPLYGGLEIEPQIGLLPLDRNPRTGLWEFWHLQTGDRPEPNPAWPDDAGNRWLVTERTGLVFVLIPGGTFDMGAKRPTLGATAKQIAKQLEVKSVDTGTLADRMGIRKDDVILTIEGATMVDAYDLNGALRHVLTGDTVTAVVVRDGAELELTAIAEEGIDSPNVDPYAEDQESDVDEMPLDPFFLSKYEMTQGQWQRFVGENPSMWGSERFDEPSIAAVHPVEHVSWDEADRTLRKLSLLLPTESQWEYACRAGTRSVWHTGSEPGTLAGHANIADERSFRSGYWEGWSYEKGFEDRWSTHAPVGSLEPNPFGLHDMHGNVGEWCRDRYAGYDYPPRVGDGWRQNLDSAGDRIYRGGSFFDPAAMVRSAMRYATSSEYRSYSLGVRPSRAVTQ